MDGQKTYVLTYQDQDGTVFTARLASDDPSLGTRVRTIRLKELFGVWGYQLLQVAAVDELYCEIPAPPYRPALKLVGAD